MKNDVSSGALGLLSTFGAIAVAHLPDIVLWEQAVSLLVGIVVGVLMAIRLYIRIKRHYLSDNETSSK